MWRGEQASRACSFPLVYAAASFLYLLLSYNSAAGDWESYHSAIDGIAKDAINTQTVNEDAKALASRIVRGVKYRFPEVGYGIQYTALVWGNAIRPGYEDIVQPGAPAFLNTLFHTIHFRDGMVPLQVCHDAPTIYVTTPDHALAPCLTGGSVAVTARNAHSTLLNAMVVYALKPRKVPLSYTGDPNPAIAILGIISDCEANFPRFNHPYQLHIDLTAMANCIQMGYDRLFVTGHKRHPRGIAVFPSYHEPHGESSGYGLCTEGRIIFSCTDVKHVEVNGQDMLAVCYLILLSEKGR